MIPLLRHAPAAAVLTATFVLAGCSGSGPGGAPATNPSVTFGAQASTMPGMAGGTGGMATPAPGSSTASSAPDTPVGGPTIDIDDFAFAPASLTVPAGSTVTWTNKDGEPHTVVAHDGTFHSPTMDTNGTFSFTFATAGTFDYVCSIHPFMHGTVVVTK
jgi:amicyanin